MTSLAHAFVHAIVPRNVNRDEQFQLFEQAGIKRGECVYCGSRATDEDHFRGLVKGGRPSGHFHTSDNLVPSCGPCNQSKGAADWRKWMNGNAPGSPARRGVVDLTERVERLSAFEGLARTAERSINDLREIAGTEVWDAYWAKLQNVKDELREAEKHAEIIRSRLDAAFVKQAVGWVNEA